MTQAIATDITTDGDTDLSEQIQEGQYFFGVSGDFDGATVELFANIGPAREVPILDISYTSPGSDIIWLPRCTMFLRVNGAGASTDINAAMSEVSTKLDRF